MIKVEVTDEFTLEKFNELKNIVRAGKEEEGKLFPRDVFECDGEMAKYLAGDNNYKKAFVKIIEVIPEKDKTAKEIKIPKVELDDVKDYRKEEKPVKKTTAKKTKKA